MFQSRLLSDSLDPHHKPPTEIGTFGQSNIVLKTNNPGVKKGSGQPVRATRQAIQGGGHGETQNGV